MDAGRAGSPALNANDYPLFDGSHTDERRIIHFFTTVRMRAGVVVRFLTVVGKHLKTADNPHYDGRLETICIRVAISTL